MHFKFTKQHLNIREQKIQRFLEILPGLTSWTILIGMTSLSFLKPITAAIFIIAFEFYWLLRLLYLTIFLILSYYLLIAERSTDWMAMIRSVDDLDRHLKNFSETTEKIKLSKRLVSHFHHRELRNLQRSRKFPPLSKDIYHLVILPIIKESREIVEPSVESLGHQQFPADRILVVFALEDRAKEEIKESVFTMEKKYKNAFWDTLTVVHPSNLPGEARVKGANVTYAAKKAAEYFQAKGIPFENIVVSCFDSDTVVGPEYFSALTYYFMITPNRIQSSFQPIPVYHNNIWNVPGFARVIETGSSFFQLVEATNPEKLVTFSSHSMSFKALVDVNYWPVDMISDDSAIYWKSFIHYDGKYQVVPMYITVSMDIAATDRWGETIKSVYKQKRRWAWGVENFPIVVRAFLKSKKISLYNKFRYGFKLFEGHISWATWGFLLSIIGWIPPFFAEREFASSVVYYNAPLVIGTIFNLALLSLVTSIFLSIELLPRQTLRLPLRKKIEHAVEWLMIPFILVFFNSLPALDAQTRLMLGRYMEFWVSDKKRKAL